MPESMRADTESEEEEPWKHATGREHRGEEDEGTLEEAKPEGTEEEPPVPTATSAHGILRQGTNDPVQTIDWYDN